MRTPTLSRSPWTSTEDKDGLEGLEEDFMPTSISRGVFVFRRGNRNNNSPQHAPRNGKKRKSRSKRLFSMGEALDSNPMPPGPASDSFVNKSHLYEKHLEHLSATFERLQGKMFSDVVEAVFGFVAGCRSGSHASSSFGVSIPTSALLTGVNLPDHDAFFSALTRRLREAASPHVAVLRSASDGKTLLAMVQAVVAQLMRVEDDVSVEMEDDEDERVVLGKRKVKRSSLVFPTLEAWYSNQHPPPSKKAKTGAADSDRPALVIVLEDFESFAAGILQDFIAVLIELSTRLPLVLVLGVATTVSAVHDRLPQSVTSHLHIETFCGQKSTQLLESLLEHTITDEQLPFKLGGNTLNHLLEMFVSDNFSVSNFLSYYKYCLIEHYTTSQIVPKLCASKPERDAAVASLTDRELDRCRALASFRRFVEQDAAGRSVYLTDDSLFREMLVDCLDVLDEEAERFVAFVSGLHVLTRDLPGRPLGRQMYSVYRRGLSKNIVESHEYREAFKFLSVMGLHDLKRKLEAFSQCLKGRDDDPAVKATLREAKSHLSALAALEKLPLVKINVNSLNEEEEVIRPLEKLPLVEVNTNRLSGSNDVMEEKRHKAKLSMQDLQKNLLAQDASRKSSSSSLDSVRRVVLDFLHESFSTYLKPPSRLPFHEVKFFDKVASVQRHLFVAPRAVLQTALEDPAFCLAEEAGGVISDDSRTHPDVCTVYRIHAECGKLINVHDWLLSWVSLMSPDEDLLPGEIDPALQARFTQAVSSLQLMGFVKPSRRKADHMTRLTWGGC